MPHTRGTFGTLERVAFIIVGSAALLIPVSDLCAARDFPSAVSKLIEQSRKEGKINISWTSMGFHEGARRFEQGFNKYYGLNVKFNYTPGLAFAASTRKIAEEYEAGKPAFRDISLIAGSAQLQFQLKSKVDIPLDWTALLPHIPKPTLDRLVTPGGGLIRFLSQAPTIMYNTNVIPSDQAPKTLNDLLNPKWKGMIASTPFAANFEDLDLHPLWRGDGNALKFVTAFSTQITGLIRCAELDRIATGEFPIFAMTCEPGLVTQLKDKGAPVDQVIPLDLRLIHHWYFGVPKNAQNPATAQLFVAWIMTPEGQAVLWENEGADMHLLAGSRNKAIFDAVAKAAGGPMYEYSIDEELAQDASAFRSKVLDLFRAAKPN